MKFADRVKETTTTTGTGALTLAGAATGFRTFAAALTNGDMVPYVIEAADGSAWETGIGTYNTGVLTRTTVTASSTGSALNLPAGTHVVYLGMIARAARDIDYATSVSITGATALTVAAVGRHHVCSGTTADYEVDLPTSGLATGDLISIEMSGGLTKLVTIDAGASALIDGERYRVLWAQENCVLRWDGAGWTKISGKSIPMMFSAISSSTQTGIADSTFTTAVLGTELYDFGAVFSSNTFVARRAGLWAFGGCVNMGATGATLLRAITQIVTTARKYRGLFVYPESTANPVLSSPASCAHLMGTGESAVIQGFINYSGSPSSVQFNYGVASDSYTYFFGQELIRW